MFSSTALYTLIPVFTQVLGAGLDKFLPGFILVMWKLAVCDIIMLSNYILNYMYVSGKFTKSILLSQFSKIIAIKYNWNVWYYASILKLNNKFYFLVQRAGFLNVLGSVWEYLQSPLMQQFSTWSATWE